MHKIDIHECIECGFCASICPKQAISERKDFAYEIDDNCINCSLCAKNCPVDAISAPLKVESRGSKKDTYKKAA